LLVISHRLVGKLFHSHGYAAAKLLSPKLLCIHGKAKGQQNRI